MKSKNKNQCAITFSPAMLSTMSKRAYIHVAVAELILSLSQQTELSPEEIGNHIAGYLHITDAENFFSHLENDKKYLLSCIKEEQELFIKKEF